MRKKAKKLAKKARREGKIFDAPPIAGGKPITKKTQTGSHHSHDVSHSHSHDGSHSHDHDHDHDHASSSSSFSFFILLFFVFFAFIGTTIYLVTQNPALLASLKKRLLEFQKK